MFRRITLREIPYKAHKEILEGMVNALQADLGRRVELGVRCSAKNTSGWSSQPWESWMVQPRYVIRDSRRKLLMGKPIIFEAGDGNVGGFLPLRILKLLGVIKQLPEEYGNAGFGYQHTFNESYFQGAKSRELSYVKDHFAQMEEMNRIPRFVSN